MLAEVTVDGMDSAELRRSVEDMVRNRQAEAALQHLQELLAPLCSDQGPLPAEFVRTEAAAIDFAGTALLRETIQTLDECGEPVSALAFELDTNAIDPEDGEPLLATRFFFDTAWPFSECTFAELLEGFNELGTAWHNDHADADERILRTDGLAPMVDALVRLRKTNAAQDEPGQDCIRAELLGTLYLAVLFHIALRDMALRGSLPRPLAVFCATHNGPAIVSAPAIAVLDEPVANEELLLSPVSAQDFGEETDEEPEAELESEPEPRESLAELFSAPATETALDPSNDPDTWHLPPPDIHTTGSQLRRKFVTEESIDELTLASRPGLLARLLRRR